MEPEKVKFIPQYSKAQQVPPMETPGVVDTDKLTCCEKLRWNLKQHRGALNMALCILVLFILASVIIVSFVFITAIFPPDAQLRQALARTACADNVCMIKLCETVPMVLPKSFEPRFLPIATAWQQLLDRARSNNQSLLPITIASQYWTMQDSDIPGGPWDNSGFGENIYKQLKEFVSNGGEVTVVDSGNFAESVTDLDTLSQNGASTYTLNISKVIGNGILHTKSWLVGPTAFYLGSANMDWRALSEVKEMGVLVDSCTCLASDVARIQSIYVGLASGKIEYKNIPRMPQLQALTNRTKPMRLTTVDGQDLEVYLSSSPPQFLGRYRTSDADAVVDLISNAHKSICIEVMDYSPALVFEHPRKFWPIFDDAIRKAAYQNGHNLKIKMLIGYWKHTARDQYHYLQSLQAFHPAKIEVRLFKVPGWNSSDKTIPPYSRVNHAKFLVTETSAWIGEYCCI